MTRPLDFVALAAYSDEVRSSTPAILQALDAVERDRADAEAAHEAYRLIHALKGAASMVGLAALGYLLNQAEELLDDVVAGPTALSDELVALLRATTPRFADYVQAAVSGAPTEPIARDLADAYRVYAGQPEGTGDAMLQELLDHETHALAARDQTPEPATVADADLEIAPDNVPPELAEVFAEEAQEHLQVIARITTQLVSASADAVEQDVLLELRRAVHTLKGAAGVVGYKAASRLAHRMEDLLDCLAEGRAVITADAARLMAASSDTLDDLIHGASSPDLLRDRVRHLIAGYDVLMSGVAPQAPGFEEAAPAIEEHAQAASEPAGPAPVERAAERRQGPVDRRKRVADRRGGGQIARVPFERLGDLVRIVSELVITRSTFDQHYAGLIDQVDELKLSTARLRRVAQKLEADYEVRALAGQFNPIRPAGAPGAPIGHGFDELEFDRYTDFHLLTRELGETASDIGTISTRLGDTIGDFDGDLTRLGRLTREVQDKVMEFRMVPLVTLASRLERAVRVTAEACGKDVELVLEGENVALDKTLLEEMTDPLLHLLRNAVDHGIETPHERLAAAKPERGRIVVRAAHEGTDVLIEVEDDGAGLDVERIRRAAVDRGYVGEAEAAALGLEALSAFVFEPGFTTARRLSEVSGRGVGLDIVKAKVTRLNGRLRLASKPGGGTTVTVRVPMTLAITRVLLIRAGGQTMGVPLGAVVQIVRPDAASIAQIGGERVLTVDGRTYPLRDLAETLGLPHAVDLAPGQKPVLVTNLGGRRVALGVDEIVQSRDAVVKTLGTHLRRVTGVWGATLLGDGTVILILNPADLAGPVSAADVRVAHGAARLAPAPAAERDAYTVLVVDDSLSMRHVLSSAIKRAGWNPVQARDGVDALEVIHRGLTPPDLILLDIEMPRMDGYEFLSTLRSQPAYARVPIVMLTSRGGEKHRDKAMALGATDYVVKPFQEEALLKTMARLMGAARGVERKAS